MNCLTDIDECSFPLAAEGAAECVGATCVDEEPGYRYSVGNWIEFIPVQGKSSQAITSSNFCLSWSAFDTD